MHSWDLEKLRQEYAQGKTREERYIRSLLDGIVDTLEASEKEEFYYADKIARDFCQVIDLIKRQQKKELETARCCAADRRQPQRYDNSEALLRDFYNYYKKEGQADYYEIDGLLAKGETGKVNYTLRDYVARIRTFAGPRYLWTMFDLEEMGHTDPLLFLYDNIELVLAEFDTRDTNGQPVKQKVNLRSALRKLSQFKRDKETLCRQIR